MNEMTIDQLEARLNELAAIGENPEERTNDELAALVEERKAILAELESRKQAAAEAAEKRNKVAAGELGTDPKPVIERNDKKMTEAEIRAQKLIDEHRMEIRALLSTGTIAKPTKVGGINGIASDLGSIVDDVTAVELSGNGAYVVAYQVTPAVAADVTDGVAIGGTEPTFNYVTINPAEWGIVGQISRQVKKVSPLAYEAAVSNAALEGLRAKAEKKIYAAILASSLAEAKTYALNAEYLRDCFLGYKGIAGKGTCKLYLCRADLTTLSKVRGTNEKRALYDIAFDEGSTVTGTISEGGFAVRFSITEELTTGTQLFGQPATVEMPMWDGYTIDTDESRYFEMNQIGYRGLQTANADLCALHGMQIVTAS